MSENDSEQNNEKQNNKIELKCGKTFSAQSLFINPQTKKEGQILATCINRYPVNKNHDGLNQIEGIIASIKDWSKISPFYRRGLRSYIKEDKYRLFDRIRLIDPSLYIPFQGMKSHKEAFCKEVEWLPELWSIVNRISSIRSQKLKIESYMREIYPLLDSVAIKGFFEFQIRNNADILISPSVPITSPLWIADQVEKMSEMNRESRILLDTTLTRYKDIRDLMNLMSINISSLRETYYEDIKKALLRNRPDIIGIRIMNMDDEKIPEIETFLKFLKELKTCNKYNYLDEQYKEEIDEEEKEIPRIPIFVFNVREFGYVTFCHGADVISMPIAKSPYITRMKGGVRPPSRGSYYHPIDMIDYRYEELRTITRPKNYRFPCHCEICENFTSLVKVDKPYWNEFRKVHFLLIKNMEIKEFRETKVPLKTALADKFGRSKKTAYVSFLN